MIFRSDLHSGPADVSDLRRDGLIQWQHRHYFALLVVFGLVLPSVVPGLLFGDWLGGVCFAGAMRLTTAHHVCFACISFSSLS